MAVGAAAEVKSRLPIADVVGETVTLKKAGQTLKGLCPFHGEKTPSFVVTPARESWKCFGCGLGGDVFSFVMQRDGIGFPEALKTLAAKAGVELDERSRREDAHRARLREVLTTALTFYHDVLWLSRVGRPALDYLHGRGFTDETIESFGLGYAPAGWDLMARRLIERRGVKADELAEVGLTTPGRRGPMDRFRNRVIFPIRDASGGPIGLGGRLLPRADADEAGSGAGRDRGPKYLNSPATPLFDKSRTLYLLDRAKGAIRRTGRAVIVEGYTDALMAHQAGFSEVVASLGTALTPHQVAAITRYGHRIALAYDVDAAGERAGALGARALGRLVADLARDDSGVDLDDVRVVRLPDGRDPDEVIRENPDAWRTAVDTARPIVDHLIDAAAGEHNLRAASGRERFVTAVLPLIDELPPVMRATYEDRVRKLSGVEERVLHEARSALRRRPAPIREQIRLSVAAVTGSEEALRTVDILRAVTPVEAELLRLLLLVPDEQPRVADALGPDLLPSTVARELFRAIVFQRAPDDRGLRPGFDREALLASLDEETRALAIALFAKAGPDPASLPGDRIRYEIENLLLDLEADRIEERVQYNLTEQADAERRADHALMERLLNQQRAINEERRSLDRRREQARLFARPAAARA